jgi:fructose-1-phosphate kinase PfkB-like protein
LVGFYEYDLNEAKTLDTRLNVFEKFSPNLPESYRSADCVFLANIDPDLQMRVLRQVRRPKLIAADTMNLWISTKKESLKALCREIDILILNDGEARQLSGKASLIQAGRLIQSWGPKFVVVKKGEHGVLLFSKKNVFSAPAYPLEEVFDPTGAGDTFAGGFVGYLNKQGNRLDEATLHKALFYGTVMASFTVERFSLERLSPSEPRISLDGSPCSTACPAHPTCTLKRFPSPACGKGFLGGREIQNVKTPPLSQGGRRHEFWVRRRGPPNV